MDVQTKRNTSTITYLYQISPSSKDKKVENIYYNSNEDSFIAYVLMSSNGKIEMIVLCVPTILHKIDGKGTTREAMTGNTSAVRRLDEGLLFRHILSKIVDADAVH